MVFSLPEMKFLDIARVMFAVYAKLLSLVLLMTATCKRWNKSHLAIPNYPFLSKEAYSSSRNRHLFELRHPDNLFSHLTELLATAGTHVVGRDVRSKVTATHANDAFTEARIHYFFMSVCAGQE